MKSTIKRFDKDLFVTPWLYSDVNTFELRKKSKFIRKNVEIVYREADVNDKMKIKEGLKRNILFARVGIVEETKRMEMANVGLYITSALTLTYLYSPVTGLLQLFLGGMSLDTRMSAKSRIEGYEDLIEAYNIIEKE